MSSCSWPEIANSSAVNYWNHNGDSGLGEKNQTVDETIFKAAVSFWNRDEAQSGVFPEQVLTFESCHKPVFILGCVWEHSKMVGVARGSPSGSRVHQSPFPVRNLINWNKIWTFEAFHLYPNVTLVQIDLAHCVFFCFVCFLKAPSGHFSLPSHCPWPVTLLPVALSIHFHFISLSKLLVSLQTPAPVSEKATKTAPNLRSAAAPVLSAHSHHPGHQSAPIM